jgi:diadenosine tetraphosphatase ApaH/serine/threonine PP2A family protein phosphatase
VIARPHPVPVPQDRPCVVVFGIGHSNTTITTRQLASLGWSLGDADEEYAESVSFRAANNLLTRGEYVTPKQLCAVVDALPEPWVLKNTHLFFTLRQWQVAFAKHTPVLLWLQKDLDSVQASFDRRGENAGDLRAKFAACEAQYRQWPWAKLAIRAEDVATAVGLFDLGRVCHAGDAPAG